MEFLKITWCRAYHAGFLGSLLRLEEDGFLMLAVGAGNVGSWKLL